MIELSKDIQKAKTHALKIIGMRDYSGAEIIKKLGKYYEPETCKNALEYLRELGYQNDLTYAEKLASHLFLSKRYGMRKARYEMKLKGLSEEDIDASFEPYDDKKIHEILIEIIEKKYAQNLDDYAGVKKCVDALMRRGYDYSDIRTVISQVKENIELDYEM